MATFSVKKQDMPLTGETYTQSGVVDNSTATLVNAVAGAVRPVAGYIQGTNLIDDLKAEEDAYSAEMEQLGAEQPQSQEVTDFEGRIARLKEMSARMPSGGFESRARAELKKRINQTPGLARELTGVFNSYMSGVSGGGAGGSSKATYLQDPNKMLMEIDKQGVQELKLTPGWTNNPEDVRYAQARLKQKQDLQFAQDMSQLRQYSKEEQVDNFRFQTGNSLLEIAEKGMVVPINGQNVDITDPAALATLSAADRNAAKAFFERSKNEAITRLQADAARQGIKQSEVEGTINMVGGYYDRLIAGTDNTDELTQLTNDNKVMAELLTQQVLGTPEGQAVQVLQKFGLQNTPTGVYYANKLKMGILSDPKRSIDDWGGLLIARQKGYGQLPLDKVTDEDVPAFQQDLMGITKDLRENVTRMSMEEQKQVMKVLATDGVTGLVAAFPDQFKDLTDGVDAVIPEVVAKATTSITSGYVSEFKDSGVFLQRDANGRFFALSGKDSSPAYAGDKFLQRRKDSFKTKYVDTLNSYIDAMSKLKGISEKEASDIILSYMDQDRISNLYRKAYDDAKSKYSGMVWATQSPNPVTAGINKAGRESGRFYKEASAAAGTATQAKAEYQKLVSGLFGDMEAVPEQSGQERLPLGDAPEGVADGVYTDASGNTVEVVGGKYYGL